MPSEYLGQPGHMPSLISLFKDPWSLQAHSQNLNRLGRYYFVGIVIEVSHLLEKVFILFGVKD